MFSVLAVAQCLAEDTGDDAALRKVEALLRQAGVNPQRLRDLAIRRYQDGRWPLGIKGAVVAKRPQAEPEAKPVNPNRWWGVVGGRGKGR